MNTEHRAENQAAFRRMKATIDASYPAGQFVAIYQGQIVADAKSFDELQRTIDNLGIDLRQSLVVQARHEYPETAVIL
jgi:hypothetical protein